MIIELRLKTQQVILKVHLWDFVASHLFCGPVQPTASIGEMELYVDGKKIEQPDAWKDVSAWSEEWRASSDDVIEPDDVK